MRLRRERKRAKLTQAELARFAGVRQGTVSKLETGALLDPSFEVLHKIAWALQRCGRKVNAEDLQPKRQPVLVKGFRSARRRKTAAATVPAEPTT
jgi:transcriptional regulator with XRE-family HTH domain